MPTEMEIERAVHAGGSTPRDVVIDILQAAAVARSEMTAFAASDEACYRFPEDTELAKAQRSAFCLGAAISAERR